MAVTDGVDITVVKDMGLVSNVFDDRTLAPLTGHLAIGHTRYSTTGSSTWRNAQPVYRAVGDHRVRARPQRQPREHRRARRRGGHAARHGHLRHRPRGRAAVRLDRGDGRRRRRDPRRCPGPGAGRGAAPPRGRLLAGPHGCASGSSACATPTGSGRCASVCSRRAAGCSRPSRRRSTSSAPTSSASSIPARWSSSTATACSRSAVVPGRAARPQALPVRVRLLRPARQPALRPQRAPRPGAHGRAARRAGAGRGRHGHGRARVGPAGRRGLRPGQRHPLRPGPGEEPLHRPHVHRPEPGDAGARRAHEAQPAQGEHRGQAPRRRRRLGRARHHAEGSWSSMLREAGRRRGAPAALVAARSSGRASTASTRAPGPSCWRAT